VLSPLLLIKSRIIYLPQLKYLHHLTPSNVTSKHTILPLRNFLTTNGLPRTSDLIFFNFGALTNLLHCIAFYSPTPKTPCRVQESRRYLTQKPSYCIFCLKFRCYCNMGLSQILCQMATVVIQGCICRSICRPKNHTLEPKITTLSCAQPDLSQFNCLNVCISTIVFFRFLRINQSNIKFKFSHFQKGTSLAENASFDNIRPAVFAVGDDNLKFFQDGAGRHLGFGQTGNSAI